MTGVSTSKWLAWTGPLFVVGFAVIIFGLEGSTPGEKAHLDKINAYYSSHQGRTTTAALMAPLGAVLLVLFASYLRAIARDRNPAAVIGPNVLFAGALLWAAGIMFGAAFDLTLVSSVHNHQDAVAQTMNVINNDDWIPFVGGIAITLVGAGMTVLGTRILPVWLGWVALVAGIVSLAGPGGFIGFFVGPLFLLVAGVWLAVSSRTPAPAS
jgi:hypothetical protein